MSILALATGALFRNAESRTSKAGRQFVLATIRSRDGEDSKFVRVIAFSESAQSELMRLADGDAVSVQGPLTASIYTASDGNAKISLSIVANFILPLRATPRERKPKAAAQDARTRQERLAGSWTAASGDPNDDLGF